MSEEIQDGQPEAESSAPTWRDSLDDGLKNDPTLVRFKSLDDFAKSHLELRKTIGENKVSLPKNKEDKEAWEKLYKSLGRPDSPDGYKLSDVEFPEGAKYSDDDIKGFVSKAHELGLTQEQLDGLYKWNSEIVSSKFRSLDEQKSESAVNSENSLRKEWGNSYETNVSNARKVIETFADENEREILIQNGNDPRLVKFLSKIGKTLSEDKVKGFSKPLSFTPDEANKKIAQLKSNPALLDRSHPEHKFVLEEWNRLHEAAYGG